MSAPPPVPLPSPSREARSLDHPEERLRIALLLVDHLRQDLRNALEQRDRARDTLSRLNLIPRPSPCSVCQAAVRAALG